MPNPQTNSFQKNQEYSAKSDPFYAVRTPYELTQLSRHGVAFTEFLTQKDAPVEYITGIVESNGMLFAVSPAVLIPRIETEELIEKIVDSYTKNATFDAEKPTIKILDVGTGSGYLGISVAALLHKAFPYAHFTVVFCDISRGALKLAKQNAQTLLANSIHTQFIESDLLTAINQQSFTILLANLPYIPSNQLTSLDASVRKFEPTLALAGGTDGFQLIALLLRQIIGYVNTNSHIWLEVDTSHTIELCQKAQPLLTYTSHQDSFGRQRFIQAQL